MDLQYLLSMAWWHSVCASHVMRMMCNGECSGCVMQTSLRYIINLMCEHLRCSALSVCCTYACEYSMQTCLSRASLQDLPCAFLQD